MTDDRSQKNVFVHAGFDRLAERRTDGEWSARVKRDGSARFLPVWRHRSPLADDGQLPLLGAATLDPDDLERAILLGQWQDRPCFAVDLGQSEKSPAALGATPMKGLRSIGAFASADAAALAAYAQAMVFWQRRHHFCGMCGAPTTATENGHVLTCSTAGCDNKEFPRSDPAIIVLITDGERALLGRQASWPAGHYSTLAGFVEPGESLEDAVRREVWEEAGVRVGAVRYLSSQPWPFPASLMLGFHGAATTTEICRNDDELEDVRWFSREDFVHGRKNGLPLLPPSISISFRLIEHWFDKGDRGALADLMAPTDWRRDRRD